MALTGTTGQTFTEGQKGITHTMLNNIVNNMTFSMNGGGKWLGRSASGSGAPEELDSTASGRSLVNMSSAANSLVVFLTEAAATYIALAANKFLARSSSGDMAAKDITDAALGLLDDSTVADMRTTLGLAIGTNVQAYDASLLSLASLATAANKLPYTTAADTYAETDLTAFARTLLDDANASAVLATLFSGINLPVLNHQIFTSSGSFTKSSLPSYVSYVYVELQGVGAAGGGTEATDSGKAAAGGGGGAGGYCWKRIAVADLGTTETVTLASTPSGVTGGAGNNGSASTFGTILTANGGTGGAVGENEGYGTAAGGAGGSATGGDVNITGQTGMSAIYSAAAGTQFISSGAGGSSQLGRGGANSCIDAFGLASVGYGGGGGGASSNASQSARQGANGGAAICIVRW